MPPSVLITGVSSGLGLGLAKAWLKKGARVYGLSRREPPELVGLPGFSFTSLDLSDFGKIPNGVNLLLEEVPVLDLAILNAGVLGTIADMAEVPLHKMQKVMDVNLWANKPLLDTLFSGNRKVTQVVAISSGASVNGARGWNAYSLSKAALNMLMKLYAAEKPHTHFSSLAPGLVDTFMQEQIRALPTDERFQTLERLKNASGTAGMPDPDTVAPRILAAIEYLRTQKSGEFHDLRDLH